MNDAVTAIKQAIIEFVNETEPRLMGSVLPVHRGIAKSDTMAIFYRHGDRELPTATLRVVVVEVYLNIELLTVRVHPCVVGYKERAPRRTAEIFLSEGKSVELSPIGDPSENSVDIFRGDPCRLSEWVLEQSAEWLLRRLEFKSV